jgi:large subunit ribosomal protein L25
MAEVLNVTLRDGRGTRVARKLRAAGRIPAVLYGHGEATVSLSVPADALETAIRHGTHLVDLQGAVTQSALIRDVQWDTFGVEVLHIDFARVDAGELVTVTLQIELRGTAPGVREGGIINHARHQVEIECPVSSLVDKIVVNVNALQLGQAVLAKELSLPEGARLLDDGEEVIVQCVLAAPVAEEEAAPAEAAEPEVIGRKAEAEEGEED